MSWNPFSSTPPERPKRGSDEDPYANPSSNSDPFASKEAEQDFTSPRDPFDVANDPSESEAQLELDTSPHVASHPDATAKRYPTGLPPPDPTPRLPNGQPAAPPQQSKPKAELTYPTCGVVGVANFLKVGRP